MEFLAILITVLCYLSACLLIWRLRSLVYVITLLSGHLATLVAPLWVLLYGIVYSPRLPVLTTVLGVPVFQPLVIAAAWFYTLPPLLVLFLYQTRWWFPGYMTGLLTFVVFLLYHIVIGNLGLRNHWWTYTNGVLPFDIPLALLSAVMGAMISFGLLYLLLLFYRSSLLNLLITLFPATLLLSLLVHGLLGAPFWIARILPLGSEQSWSISAGLLFTLGLIAWAVHIITSGLERVDHMVTT